MDRAQGSLDAIEVESTPELCHMYISPNTEVPRSSDTPLYVKKEQKINDRLHEKINVLKTQAGLHDPTRPPLQSNSSKDQLNRSKEQKDCSISSMLRRGKET